MNITDLGNGSSFPTFDCSISEEEIPYSIPIYLIFAVIHGLIAGIGMLGNALVVFVLLVAKDRQDTSSVTYVQNLAIADFCFLATVPFAIDQRIHIIWRSGEFMCKFAMGFMTYLNFFVSSLFLMVMSIDRYLAVNKAVSSTRLRNAKSSRLVSGVVWMVALVAVIPLAVLHSTSGGSISKCRPRFPTSEFSEPDNFALQHKRHQECMNSYITNETLQISTTGFSATTANMQNSPLLRVKKDIESAISSTTKPKKRKNRKHRKRRERRHGRRKIKPKRFRRHKSDLRSYPTTQSYATTQAPKKYLLPDLRELTEINFNDLEEYSLADFDIATMPTPLGIKDPGSVVVLENGIYAASEPFTSPNVFGSFPGNPGLNPLGFDIRCAPAELRGRAMEACKHVLPKDAARNDTCYHDEPYSFQVWIVLNFFYSYLIPCCVIVICYMAILRKLYQPTGMVRNQESRGKIRRQAMRKKVTVMVAVLVLSYIVCFTPYYIWELIKVPGVVVPYIAVCQHMSTANTTLAYINSALNPVLYTFLSDQFGSKLRLAWRRATRKTAYHFGSVMRAGERRHICVSARSKDSSKRKPTKLSPREASIARNDRDRCNGSNRVEEDQRCLVDPQNLDKNGTNNNAPTIIEEGLPAEGNIQYYNNVQAPMNKREKLSPTADDVLGDQRGIHQNQRDKCDGERQKSKRKGSLFSCVGDCTNGEDDCPHCAIEMEQITPQNDVIDDVTERSDDVNSPDTNSQPVSMEIADKQSRKVSMLSTLSNQDTGFYSANSKLCRKHKRSVRSKSKELDNIDSGKWVTASSFRSESKFPTEITDTSQI